MQVELAEQRAKEHAELEGIRQELMTLEGPSSMADSDSLIDLTDDVEDTPRTAPTQGHSGCVLAPLCMLDGSDSQYLHQTQLVILCPSSHPSPLPYHCTRALQYTGC